MSSISYKKLGIIGGGQLARMIALSAFEFGANVHIYTDKKDDPALLMTPFATVASYDDTASLAKFAASVDYLTFEFENITINCLDFLERYDHIFPHPKILKIAQDRTLEKTFISDIGIKTARYAPIRNKNDISKFGFPALLKTNKLGYDGKGQYLIRDNGHLENFVFPDCDLIAEEVIDFKKEVSIIVSRDKKGEVDFFPVAENIHRDGILCTSKIPADIGNDQVLLIQNYAKKIAINIDLIGILAIEFFIDKNEDIIVNEIAPRPHNTGHWSMNACNISQFEQLVRILFGYNLKKIKKTYDCIMENILGEDIRDLHPVGADKYSCDSHFIHIYGKEKISDRRKMAHVNKCAL
ncbi:5-(carboxyamino)imidazole ribonucleotide synthase [Anaplasmataceae bacterium AB001_6]|nr:5-(carboxyamino)imidazole ribonucleotide synthase [Anaplasmataceae bacterium AB001_6]